MLISMFGMGNAVASGFEYYETVLGFRYVGIVNFRHISTGEYQGKIMFEPFGTISSYRGETLVVFFILILLEIMMAAVFIYWMLKIRIKRKNPVNE